MEARAGAAGRRGRPARPALLPSAGLMLIGLENPACAQRRRLGPGISFAGGWASDTRIRRPLPAHGTKDIFPLLRIQVSSRSCLTRTGSIDSDHGNMIKMFSYSR